MTQIPYFRAWNHKHKVMASVWAIHWKAWDNFPHQINFVEVWKEEGGGTYELMEGGEVEIMRWTGLIDSKGKRIYEGDICEKTIEPSVDF